MSQITYADKVALSPQPDVADINKVTNDDINMIKNAHNDTDNKLTNLIRYSTDEQIIGTWINNKPIYRKVLSEIQITSSSQSINVDDLSIDKLIFLKPYYEGTAGSTGDYNSDFDSYYISSTDYRRTFFRKVGSTYTLEYRGVANGTVNYILEYTKTTD